MTEQELRKLIENGTGEIRKEYADNVEIGDVARALWDHPSFTLGIEYGMLIYQWMIDNEKQKYTFGAQINTTGKPDCGVVFIPILTERWLVNNR